MKILILSQFFSTSKGGGEYVFSVLARSLANNGNQVWIITNKIKNETYPSLPNLKIIFVPPDLKYQGGIPQGFSHNLEYSINSIRKGYSIIKNEKIDIIHSNNFAPALAGSILSTLTSVSHITTIHDVFSLCGKDYWKLWGKQQNISRLNVMLGPFFEKIMLKLKTNAIHTVSDASKDDLVKFGAKKPIYVIPNAIEYDQSEEQKVIPLQFIYIGRLVFYKNLNVVIKAIKIVKKTFPEIKLVIVGGGPYKNELEKTIERLELKNNIQFKGYVSDQTKKILLSSSQALLFPSVCEGFGLVVLEAFAQKKPVLVSKIRPLSDIVSDGQTGFVIPPYDENEWANAILRIINEPEKSQQMGMAGREVLEKEYPLKNMKESVLKMYNDFTK